MTELYSLKKLRTIQNFIKDIIKTKNRKRISRDTYLVEEPSRGHSRVVMLDSVNKQKYFLVIRSNDRNVFFYTVASQTHVDWGPSKKYVTLFLMIFDPLPCHKLSQILDPLKVCHTSEQKVNKQISRRMETALNNYNRYYILNNNKRPYWVFLINPEIPSQV